MKKYKDLTKWSNFYDSESELQADLIEYYLNSTNFGLFEENHIFGNEENYEEYFEYEELDSGEKFLDSSSLKPNLGVDDLLFLIEESSEGYYNFITFGKRCDEEYIPYIQLWSYPTFRHSEYEKELKLAKKGILEI